MTVFTVLFYLTTFVWNCIQRNHRICIFQRFHGLSRYSCKHIMKKVLDFLRKHVGLMLRRIYYTNRWIGDETLVSILQQDYYIKLEKRHLNRYIPNIYLNGIHQHQHIENWIEHDGKKVRKATFYYFSKDLTIPFTGYTRDQWIDFHCLGL